MHEDREVSRNMFSLHYCGNINLSKENRDIIKVTLRQDSISGCWKKKQLSNPLLLLDFTCPRAPLQCIMQVIQILIVLFASYPFIIPNYGGFSQL